MDILDQLLLEAVREKVLYHMTGYVSAYNILRKNVLKLSPWINRLERNDSKINKYFFASFARHPNVIFGRDNHVIFVIDWEKLKEKYKLMPFSYTSSFNKSPFRFEFEEKLVSNFPYIKNFNSYIKEIFVDQKGYSEMHPRLEIDNVYKLEVLAKQLNIPIYFTFKGDPLNLDTSRSLHFRLDKNRNSRFNFEQEDATKDKASDATREYESKRFKEFKENLSILIDIIFWDEEKIKSNIRKYFDFFWANKWDNFIWYLEHEFLGNKKNTPYCRSLFPKVSMLFRKLKINTTNDFVFYVRKWQSTWDEKLGKLNKSLQESSNPTNPETFYNNCTGYHHGQTEGTLYIYNPETEDKEVYGHLDWAKYEDKVYIHFIEVNEKFRRKGYATKLYNQLKIEFSDCKIIHTNPQPDGAKWIESLNEKVRENVLYHATYSQSLVNILKNNEFILSIASDVFYPEDNVHIYPFFLSTTRTLQSSFLKLSARPIIVLDTEKIKYNYKTTQVNYFNRTPKHYEDESEERIISKKQTMPNVSKYIKSIHIQQDESYRNLIINYAKKLNIPIYLHPDAWSLRSLKDGRLVKNFDNDGFNPPVGDKIKDTYKNCPKKLEYLYLLSIITDKYDLKNECKKRNIKDAFIMANFPWDHMESFIRFYIIGNQFFNGRDKYRKMFNAIVLKYGKNTSWKNIKLELITKYRDLMNQDKKNVE